MDTGFDPIIGALNTSMNLRELEQNVISSNIANADTPGYKAKRVEFESALRAALESDSAMKPAAGAPGQRTPHTTDPVQPEIYEDPNGVESLDGNTVDRGEEMARMSQNQLMFDASAEMLKRKLAMLKYAIQEGGGGR
jgi:flagellar basal-body rod protein FlgB